MKIAFLSDLHYEWGAPKFELEPDTDVFVCVGDVHHCASGKESEGFAPGQPRAIEALKKIIDKNKIVCPVVFVPGNHDYYRGDIAIADAFMRSDCTPQIHFLNNDRVNIDGIAFLGSTLWTDFENNAMVEFEAERCIADFSHIKESSYRFSGSHVKFRHHKSEEWLEDALHTARTEEGKDVVVCTHFCPTMQTDHPQFIGSSLKYYFHADMDYLMEKYTPKLWIFGHTHHDEDMEVFQTRVVSSQRGYAREKKWKVGYFTIDSTEKKS
jgi:Icc-related predicted phosphoesterase